MPILSIDGAQQASSGHPGAPMGMAHMAHTLRSRFLRHAPTHPDRPNRDRFVISATEAVADFGSRVVREGLRGRIVAPPCPHDGTHGGEG